MARQRQGETAIKIIVIGYGAIGRMVVNELAKAGGPAAVCGVLVRPSRLREARVALSEDVAVLTDVVDALRLDPDLIVECAGQGAVADYGEEILATGCDFMVIAVGALADDALRKRTGALYGGTAMMPCVLRAHSQGELRPVCSQKVTSADEAGGQKPTSSLAISPIKRLRTV